VNLASRLQTNGVGIQGRILISTVASCVPFLMSPLYHQLVFLTR
jgi:hypothetical protein